MNVPSRTLVARQVFSEEPLGSLSSGILEIAGSKKVIADDSDIFWPLRALGTSPDD